MLETVLSLVLNVTLLNNLLLIGFFIIFLYLFFKEHNDPDSKVNWTDLLLDDKTNKLSITKFGQFIGIATSTWMTFYLVQQDRFTNEFIWVFATYLSFLSGSYAYDKFIKHRSQDQSNTNIGYQVNNVNQEDIR